MQIVLLSDIHGNLPALERVISETKTEDSYIVMGDVVNYGPWGNECVELLDSLDDCITLRGNHEDYFINGVCTANSHLCGKFFDVCFEEFSQQQIIENYLDHYYLDDFKCIHTIEDQYIFEDTEIPLDQNYIIGHSHKQFKKEYKNYSLINPGSVGQNRQFINEINFALLDRETGAVDFRSMLYDVDTVINEMHKKGYPKECLDYYRLKDRK